MEGGLYGFDVVYDEYLRYRESDMGNNTNAIGKLFEVFASKTLAQATESSFVAAHPAAICFTPDGQIVFGGDVYSRQKTWTGSQAEYDAIESKDANTTYYVNHPDPSERRVYVGETLVMGAGADPNFVGLVYGGAQTFYFSPQGRGFDYKGEWETVTSDSNGNFSAAVSDAQLGSFSESWFFNKDGTRFSNITEIQKFPKILSSDMKYAFAAQQLDSFDGSGMEFAKTADSSWAWDGMLSNNLHLMEANCKGMPISGNCKEMFKNCELLETVRFDDVSMVADATEMFSGCTKLASVGIDAGEGWFTGLNCGDKMFSGCEGLAYRGVFVLGTMMPELHSAKEMFSHTCFKEIKQYTQVENVGTGFYLFGRTRGDIDICNLFAYNAVLEKVHHPIYCHGISVDGLSSLLSPFFMCTSLKYAVISGLSSRVNGKTPYNPLCGAPQWGSEDDAQCVIDTLLTYSEDASANAEPVDVMLDKAVADRLSLDVLNQISAKGYRITTIY